MLAMQWKPVLKDRKHAAYMETLRKLNLSTCTHVRLFNDGRVMGSRTEVDSHNYIAQQVVLVRKGGGNLGPTRPPD